MTNWAVKLIPRGNPLHPDRIEIDHGLILGLKEVFSEMDEFGDPKEPEPDTWIPVSSLNFPPSWKRMFFGGLGVGEEASSLEDALHLTLYDLYQVDEGLHDGDTFTCEWEGQKYEYVCKGVHVLIRGKEDIIP